MFDTYGRFRSDSAPHQTSAKHQIREYLSTTGDHPFRRLTMNTEAVLNTLVKYFMQGLTLIFQQSVYKMSNLMEIWPVVLGLLVKNEGVGHRNRQAGFSEASRPSASRANTTETLLF